MRVKFQSMLSVANLRMLLFVSTLNNTLEEN